MVGRFRSASARQSFSAAALLLASSVCGCEAREPPPRPLTTSATLDIHVVSPLEGPTTRLETDAEGNPVHLVVPPVLTAADVASIQRYNETNGSQAISIQLTPTGGEKMLAATSNPVGVQLAVIANGDVLCVANIRSPMSTGFVVTSDAVHKDRDAIFTRLTGDPGR